MTAVLPPPVDATLSVTKAARLLGVHANTVRAWSDAGRLRYYRINPRGDRRYRLSDLHRFMAAAEHLEFEASEPAAAPAQVDLDLERHRIDLAVLDSIARSAASADDLDELLRGAARIIRDTYDHHLVVVWERRGELLSPRAVSAAPGVGADPIIDRPRTFGILGRALTAGRAVGSGGPRADPILVPTIGARLPVARLPDGGRAPDPSVVPGGRPELAVAIPGLDEPWGVLLLVGESAGSLGAPDADLASVLADALGAMVTIARRQENVSRVLHRAEALRRVATDIGSRLDLDRILAGLVDHAMVLFEGDRAAVFMRRPDGRTVAEVSRGLSGEYLASVRDVPEDSLSAAAVAAHQPLFATTVRDDPRASGVRAAIVQEGFDTACSAPLHDGGEFLGLLEVYHDRPHRWTDDELETMAALATQASVAIRAAQDYGRMATWAAQLQSIQQLGTRLSRLTSVADIGHAIATELRQLIDYHNVRVYRLIGRDLVPVAMLGQVGEYVDETPDQLRTTVGEGITGWVAEHRVAQNLADAAKDPRAFTIAGTEDDLDESMLLAPMLFEEDVLGVLVLSKLGLHQFSDDDLRLLVIYASFAAQAMANAATTERLREQTVALERRLRGQRELLQLTETILTTLDRRAVLDAIIDRLDALISCDNIAMEIVDPATGLLTPLTARGIHADAYMEPWLPGETGIAPWVVQHNEPTLIEDERRDDRVNHFRADLDALDGSMIVVPLRGREGAVGVLTLERLGLDSRFTTDDFELVQLFAGQVSIALQNAELFRAVEIRAQTDDLTGLLNHGTFQDWLARDIADGSTFSLIMVDLDGFRDVNNALGHQAGDTLLRKIAGSLVRAAGRETDLVFRYGGDEFAFLLPHTDAAGAHAVAERVRTAVADNGEGVTASVGIATYPVDGRTPAEVLLAADRACYVAKRGGGDRVATAAEGLALAAEFSPQAPTPIDSTTQVPG